MKYEFGFIGTGNMGSALARAARASWAGPILLANKTAEKAEKLASEIGADVSDNLGVAASCRYIFLGVKPQMMADMLSGISDVLKERAENGDRFILVSMAAGLTVARLREMAGGDYPIIRIMPNTPAAVGEGMTLYTCDGVLDDERDNFLRGLSAAGYFDELPEKLFDAGGAITGCGPAFVDLFIEALADGGVAAGVPRAKALAYAKAMIKGAAALAIASEKHPGALKDEVCSPAGSTIAGVLTLERRAFRSAVSDAVIASYEKTAELSKK